MNIIEKLEAVVKSKIIRSWNEKTDARNECAHEILRDLYAITEECKKQEPSAWKYRYHEEGDWIISKDRDLKTEGWVREQYPNFTIFPLFTHPPLSDETVKDAERYAFLRDNCAYETVTGCWDIEFLEHGDTLNEAIDREIDEVKKASNAEAKA